MSRLYIVRCCGMTVGTGGKDLANGVAYVIAEDAESAYQKVKSNLDERKIGFDREREMDSVTLLAEEGHYPKCAHRLFL